MSIEYARGLDVMQEEEVTGAGIFFLCDLAILNWANVFPSCPLHRGGLKALNPKPEPTTNFSLLKCFSKVICQCNAKSMQLQLQWVKEPKEKAHTHTRTGVGDGGGYV